MYRDNPIKKLTFRDSHVVSKTIKIIEVKKVNFNTLIKNEINTLLF